MKFPPLPATMKKRDDDDHGPLDDIERKPLIICINDDDFESRISHEKNTGERRQLRSGYSAILNLIKEKGDDIGKSDSKKFKSIMDEVDMMHQLVKKPREQIADAEALLGLAGSLETSLRSHAAGTVTPTAFIARLFEKFGQLGGTGTHGNEKKQLLWKELGLQISPIFRNGRGGCTMLHPVKIEIKQRKVPVYRKPRTKQSTKAEPKQLNSASEERTDTDTNMKVMFGILKEKRTVKLENLLLNRKSFAQTVENLFALSFLVKDGRVSIAVDENGSHLVSPRNAPSSGAVMSGDVVYSHFIFRLDFCDWKFMKVLVPEGEELMPVRNGVKLPATSQEKPLPMSSQSELTSNISQAELAPKSFQPVRMAPAKTYSRKMRVLQVEGQQMGEKCPEIAG